MADADPMFASAAAVRAANRPLLDRLDRLDPDEMPADFLADIEAFRARAAATGVILSSVEDRSETQTAINFWTTILFGAAGRPAPAVLAQFDREAARARIGDAAPYKGLEPFQVEDSDKFFGRSKAVAEMLDKLSHHRLLAVLGLSGSGKSSVVRAGLIPRLSQGAMPGSEDWLILAPVVPGRSPMQALTGMVRQLNPGAKAPADPAAFVAALDEPGRRVLVSVDQFEELFTLDSPEEERRAFLDMLVAAATTGAQDHIVLLTMRSEFDSRLRRYEAFDALFEAGRVQIPALSPAELRSAIQEPAEQAGLSFDPGLSEELVQAVVGEPAGLPLLQFTLLELWKLRSDENRLTWDAYKTLGGNPRDILAGRADEVYHRGFKLQEDRDISRRIFLTLVQIGSGLEPTSRRVLRSDLDETVGRGRDNVDRVLDKWRDNGLLRISPPGPITPDSQVEVAHEALIRNWRQLGEWIEDAFASTRRRRLLTEQALAWKEGKAGLLGELSLEEADTYGDISDEEREYVEASRAGVERARKRMRRRNRIAFAGSVVMALLTLAAILSYREASRSQAVAVQQKAQADSARERAQLSANAAFRAERASRLSRMNADRQVQQARDHLTVANRQLGALRSQMESTSRALRQALARRTEVRTTTAVETGNLVLLLAQVDQLETQRADLERQRAELARQVESLETQVQLAEAGRETAEQQTEAARNVAPQIVAALGRSDVFVRTTALLQPAVTQAVRQRMPTDLTRRRARAPLGLPDAPLVVDRRVYTAGFDPAILSPRWVAFTVDARSTLPLRRLPLDWAFDPDIPPEWQTGEDAYRNNSYDRGHLVRRADALVGPSEAEARASEAEIFYYSVTVPQAAQTNQITWTAVERYTTELSARLGPVHVVAGPVYPDLTAGNGAYLTLGRSRTTVPLYLYRILLRRDASGRWRSLAFLVPNDFSSSRDPLQFVTSVSEIERLTGLRFFPELSASDAAALKSNALPADFEGAAAAQ